MSIDPNVHAAVEEHFRRAAGHHAAGYFQASVGELQQALRLAPRSPESHFNMGNVLRDGGNLNLAVEAFIHALKLAEGEGKIYPDAALNLGDVLARQGRHAEALEAFRFVANAQPGRAQAHMGLGIALVGLGRFDEAVAADAKAVALEPSNVQLLNNMALAQYRAGYPHEALATYDRALALDPGYPEGHTHRALMLLLLGRIEEGFAEYEWRWQTDFFRPLRLEGGAGEWQGEELAGRSIVAYAEQGYGDVFMFARYLPSLAERGARVIALVEPAVAPLISRIEGVAEVIPTGTGRKLPDHDYAVPLMSLPHRFGTSGENMPSDVPYLRADPAQTDHWRSLLPAETLKVGIVWAGRPEHLYDAERSIPLVEFAPLATIPGITLVSLQKGSAAMQRDIDLWRPEDLSDFDATAGLIEALDLVISVDTAPAHLAGALGKPVWLLLPVVPEWRWGLSAETSPWYPGMKLFRQKTRADWSEVIGRVAAKLTSHPA